MSLNEKKSAGIENIPIKFIKLSAEYISLQLAKNFQQMHASKNISQIVKNC